MLKWFRTTGGHTAMVWWIIIVSSIVVFVFGFSVAPSLVGSGPVSESVPVGKVNGETVTYGEYQQIIEQTVGSYERQSGQDVGPRERVFLEEQAWAQMVTERALADEANRIGYGTNSRELVFTIQSSPPPWVREHPAFQTDGRFDQVKYGQALADPNNNWSGLEEDVRRVLPAQKLEEMLLASSRFSEPELRRAFQEQSERMRASIALWTPPPGMPDTSALNDAEVRAFYDQHPELFSGPAQVRAEVVTINKTTSPEDEAAALKTAQELRAQALAGADFDQLARDMSEGPLAQQGGYMGVVPVSQIPPQIQGAILAVGDSGITETVKEGNRIFLFKARREPGLGEMNYHLWQLSVPIQMSEEGQRQLIESIADLRREAGRSGLGPAAAKQGHIARESGWFSADGFDPLFAALPQAQQFATQARVGAVSMAYDMDAAWALVQVKTRREAGLYSFETVKDEVKVALARERSLEPAMASARAARAEIEKGVPFERAVRAAGANQTKASEFFSRAAPDGLLGGVPRALGLAFGLGVGQVGGPVRTPMGVYLIRKEAAEPMTEAAYEAGKGAVSQTLLNRSQQEHFGAWLEWYRQRAKVEDKRADVLVAR